MALTNAQLGYQAECKVRRWLSETLGHQYVSRSGGSRGVFDILGWDGDTFYAIQVKRNCWPSPKERAEMAEAWDLGPWNLEVWQVRVDPRKPIRVRRLTKDGWKEEEQGDA